MKKGSAFAMIVLLIFSLCAGSAAGEAGGEEKPTLIELYIQLKDVNTAMWTRDRTGDTPVYQIDAERFVSEEDIAALMNVLAVRHALQMTTGMYTGKKPPSEEEVRYFLVSELLLTAEADALHIDGWQEYMYYYREGWREPEPPTPDATDTEVLVRQGMIRTNLRRSDMTSGQDTRLPYQSSAALIDALVEKLSVKYPSTVPYTAVSAPKGPAYSDPSLGIAFDPPDGWAWVHAGGSLFAFTAPDESGYIIVTPSDFKVDSAMAEEFSIGNVTEWMQVFLTEGVTDVVPLMFAKAIDAEGTLHALATCGCEVDGIPFIYSVYLFTTANGRLAHLGCFSLDGDAGAAARAWFDGIIKEVIPAEPLAELLADRTP